MDRAIEIINELIAEELEKFKTASTPAEELAISQYVTAYNRAKYRIGKVVE